MNIEPNLIKQYAASRKITLKNGVFSPSGKEEKVEMPLYGVGTSHQQGWSDEAIQSAISDLKICLFDTATRYGTEEPLAKQIALAKSKNSNLSTKDIFICTKFWMGDVGKSGKSLFEDLLLAATQSFEKFSKIAGKNEIDLYLLHFPSTLTQNFPYNIKSPEDFRRKIWTAMEDLLIYSNSSENSASSETTTATSTENNKNNKLRIRSIGVSNFEVRHLQDIIEHNPSKRFLPAVNQIELHPFYTNEQTRKYCQERNIVVTGYCPFAKGQVFNHQGINDLVDKYDFPSVASLCLRWSMYHCGAVTIPLSTNCERQRDNAIGALLPIEKVMCHSYSGSDSSQDFTDEEKRREDSKKAEKAFKELDLFVQKFGAFRATWDSSRVA